MSNGTIYIDTNGSGNWANLTEAETGDDDVSTASTFIDSAVLSGKLYVTDGVSPVRVATAKGQTIETLKAADGGKVPERPKLLAPWRGRLVFAHTPDNPHFWKMSEIGKPDRLNEFPEVPFVGQAVSGVNAPEAGETPDIINTIIPWTDDLLLFGGDHSITALVGDPTTGSVTARGDIPRTVGQFTTVTDNTGMAFGRPWARDKMDRLYFMSSRAEAFVLRPGGKPEPISDRAIESRLQQIDFSTHYVDAVWNWEDNCVHFFVLPFGSATTQDHFIFDVQRGRMVQAGPLDDPIMLGWWIDRFGYDDIQPTAVVVRDGDDPDDRELLIGSADGHVRKWDPNANNDGTDLAGTTKHKIDAFVTMSLAPPGVTSQMMFSRLQVELAKNRNGALVEFFTTDAADDLGDPRPAFEVDAGYNPPRMERVRGNYPYMRIRNSAADESFALERVMVNGSSGGMRRPHSKV